MHIYIPCFFLFPLTAVKKQTVEISVPAVVVQRRINLHWISKSLTDPTVAIFTWPDHTVTARVGPR